MLDIFPTHMVILAMVAILLIGPKDLPRVMRVVGQWVGRGRAMANHFRSAVDEMIRESELQEMEQKWKAENERIMREHKDLVGSVTTSVTPSLPAPPADEHPTAAALTHPAAIEATPPADVQRQD